MFPGAVSELVWQDGHPSEVNFGESVDEKLVLFDNSEFCKIPYVGSDKFYSDDNRRRTNTASLRKSFENDGLNDDNTNCISSHHKANSACSLGASNEIGSFDRNRRKLDDVTTNHAENVEEEEEEVTRLCMSSPKRKRNSEEHRLFEKRRRKKINDKLKALHNLIPNSTEEVAKASLLDEVIMHIKALQRQLQMMTMGSSMYSYMPQMGFPMQMPVPMQMQPMRPLMSFSSARMAATMAPPSLLCMAEGAPSLAPFMGHPQMKYSLPPVVFPSAAYQDVFQPSHHAR